MVSIVRSGVQNDWSVCRVGVSSAKCSGEERISEVL